MSSSAVSPVAGPLGRTSRVIHHTAVPVTMTIFGIRDYIKDVLEIKREPRAHEVLQGIGNEGYIDNVAARERERQLKRAHSSRRTLRINLVICNITIYIMFAFGGIE